MTAPSPSGDCPEPIEVTPMANQLPAADFQVLWVRVGTQYRVRARCGCELTYRLYTAGMYVELERVIDTCMTESCALNLHEARRFVEAYLGLDGLEKN